MNAFDPKNFLNPDQVLEPTVKVKKAKNPNRMKQGSMFIQPTGGTGKKPLNFTYSYVGFYDADDNYLSGFSMDNVKLLSMINAGHLPNELGALFKAYAEHHEGVDMINQKML